ncbi:ABC transporter permease [Mariniblastus fucicola]|uniref:Maltose/maltodextrin import ATP-binding protein MalK n=1 Tax=Mariniblastus fucicola TaxID=980251 RepID=A0A5B9P770_9BACT|nr:ABC transporter permease [Mariniblastus fucicola]QEG22164.1 Maltose/maltodextrin import ATP-binding protein MalK [Mariniblastus fucicola]
MTTADKTSSNARIEVKDLSVIAGKKVLLENANASFDAGQITLIVGPSGVGKSILMRLIAGLTDGFGDAIQYMGDVTINGKQARSGEAGVVFQSFALFDELSPVENIRFAKACGGAHASDVSAKEILAELNVPANVPTSRLSGGQRQRLAIARTLAYNPPAILYDEPTSGLDPFTGQQVAKLIADTHTRFGKTSVIVTHDYHSLMPIADRIYVLDPQLKQLVEVEREQWATIPEKLAPMASKVRAEEETPDVNTLERLATKVKSLFETTSNAMLALLTGVLSLLPVWKSPTWGLRSLLHFLRMVTGPTAILYLIASGFISGFVTTYFTFKFLPFTDYTKPLLLEDLLTALGFATYRIFVPVLSCVLIAARCGAAVTSDIGGRQYGNQVDALRTFGNRPNFFLLTPILWAFLIGTPLLTFAAYYTARYTSLVTFLATHPGHGAEYWHQYSMRGLEQWSSYLYKGFGWLIAKLLVSGFGTAIIAYRNGMSPKYSSADVSRSVTSTILWATLYVLVVHFVFSMFEFENIVPGGK